MTHDESIRHLIHVYILVDVSASMVGASLQATRDAFDSIVNRLHQHLGKAFTLDFSLIVYESAAKCLQLNLDQPPHLISTSWQAAGASNLGKAWQVLVSALDSVEGVALCFTLTDGQPTDEVQEIGRRIARDGVLTVLIGCGRDADLTTLKPFADHAWSWHEFDGDGFSQFVTDACKSFIWSHVKADDYGNAVFG